MAVRIYYWKANARGALPMAIAAAGGVPFEHVDVGAPGENNWPGQLKAKTPFGQLPFLETADGMKLAQSLAMSRYLARKGKLAGDTDEEIAFNDMLLEEQRDLFELLVRARFPHDNDKAKAHNKLLEQLPAHLGHLERLLPDGQTQFNAKRVLVGDIAIYVILNQVLGIDPTALDHNTPKLKKFYEHIHSGPVGQKFTSLGLGQFFTAP